MAAALRFFGMPTLVMDPVPRELEVLLERRRELGLDRWDEVWEGVLHMNPPPSREHERIASLLHSLLRPFADAAGLDLLGGVGIGVPDENRVPDLALQHPADAKPQWQETVALAVEIRSPDDDTLKKLDFYAAHRVNELLIVDPHKRSVDWLSLGEGEYRPIQSSGLIELGPAELASQINRTPV